MTLMIVPGATTTALTTTFLSVAPMAVFIAPLALRFWRVGLANKA
jgi:hypothetical protein